MDNASALPLRGKTWFDGQTPPTSFAQTVSLEGQLKAFEDLDPATLYKRSGRQVICRLVRNVATITLAPKRVVTYAAGFRGRRVDGYGRTDHVEAAGVVDDQYATGIPANDLGWIVVSGPCLVKTPLEGTALNVFTEGDIVTALTAATSQATTSGRVQTAALTSSVTGAMSIERGAIGRAMSAKTTANTNADVLIDITLLKAS